jgi:hypothetical protein
MNCDFIEHPLSAWRVGVRGIQPELLAVHRVYVRYKGVVLEMALRLWRDVKLRLRERQRSELTGWRDHFHDQSGLIGSGV